MSDSEVAEPGGGPGPGGLRADGGQAGGEQAPQGQFRLEVEPGAPDAWVRVQGELDIYTSPELSKAIEDLLEAKPERLMVDMSLVSFMDSSAISVLVRSQKSAEASGSKLVVHSPARGVRRTLDLVGLSEHLPIES